MAVWSANYIYMYWLCCAYNIHYLDPTRNQIGTAIICSAFWAQIPQCFWKRDQREWVPLSILVTTNFQPTFPSWRDLISCQGAVHSMYAIIRSTTIKYTVSSRSSIFSIWSAALHKSYPRIPSLFKNHWHWDCGRKGASRVTLLNSSLLFSIMCKYHTEHIKQMGSSPNVAHTYITFLTKNRHKN